MTRIGVQYFLTRHQPDVDLIVPFDVEVRCDMVDEPGWSPLLPLYSSVASAVASSPRPLVMCGDCTVALGVVAGLQRTGLDPAIVWFDAHGDVQTMETTTSGFLGGMPLRLLVGYRPELAATALGLRPIAEDRVVLVDARDLDPPEALFLAESPMRHVPLPELSPQVLPDGPLFVHLDLDIVDPTELPAVRYPAPGGPSLAAVMEAARMLFRTGRVVGVCVACTWSPGSVLSEDVKTLVESALSEWESPTA